MNQVFLGLGGNLGDKLKNLEDAILLINNTIGKVVQRSNIYQTPPHGFEAEDDFYNCCIEIETRLSPKELLTSTQEIEKELGREKKSNNGQYTSRVMDIDILFYNDVVMDEATLTIPHPKINERKFVLVPLIEIAKSKIHPITHMTIFQLLENCIDESIINTVQ